MQLCGTNDNLGLGLFKSCVSMVLIKFGLTWIGILGPDGRALERSG